MSAPRLSEGTKLEILSALAKGEPLKAIAVRFGVNESYPSILAKRRGLPLRPKMTRRK